LGVIWSLKSFIQEGESINVGACLPWPYEERCDMTQEIYSLTPPTGNVLKELYSPQNQLKQPSPHDCSNSIWDELTNVHPSY